MNADSLVDTVVLGEDSYALISPNKISFLSGANRDEVAQRIKAEKLHLTMLNITPTFDKEIESITFLPTLNCNLRCIYCYAKGGEQQTNLTEDLAKIALDDLASKTTGTVQIDFAGGGEPFFNFKVMDYILKYAKKLFREVHVRLVTNGTFNKDHLQWILDNDIDLRISFDGLAHRYQRPFKTGMSSSEAVENNLKELVKLNKKFKVQCIVTEESANYIIDTIQHLSKLGVKLIKIEPVHISEISRKSNQLKPPTPQQFVDKFIEALEYIMRNKLDMKLDTAFLSRPTTGYYCGLRHNIIITPEGNITGCVEFTRKIDPFSELIVNGNCSLDEKKLLFNERAKAELKRLHMDNYKACHSCNLKLICKSGCPARNLFDKGNTFMQSPYTCAIEKNLIPRVLHLISKNSAYSNIVFDKFKIDEC